MIASRAGRGALLLGILGILLLAWLWAVPLAEPDEGRYGDIAASMVRTGDWITPRLNGIRYYEKPPFYFWASAVSIEIFGPTPFAIRLPSVAATLATCLVLLVWGRRAEGRGGHAGAGELAALAYASLPIVAALGRAAIVDPWLVLWTTLELYFSWEAFARAGEGEPRRRWILGFWGAAALATLVKGPVGAILPASGVGIYLLLRGDFRGIGAWLAPWGPALFLVIAAPWYAAMESANPGYVREFLVGQYLGRFTAQHDFGRVHPFWFYLPVFLGIFLPWTLFLPRIGARVAQAWRARGAGLNPTILFLALAIAAPVLVLSLSASKLAYYLLPTAPPFALLVATTILGDDPNDLAAVRRLRGVGGAVGAFALVLAAACGVAAVGPFDELARWAMRAGSEETAQSPSVHEWIGAVRAAMPWSAGYFAVVGIVGVVIAGVARRAGAHRCALALALSLVLPSPALILAARAGEHAYSADPVARLVLEAERGGEPIVMHGPFLRTLPFRLRRPVVLWNATYAEFGHEIEAPEASEHSLQGSNDALAVFAREHPDAIWVSEESHFHRPLAQILGFPLEHLGSACGYDVWRRKTK
jgi:4-amino-4-deoxy-L-arabinose transferase-like glycosyltransferase